MINRVSDLPKDCHSSMFVFFIGYLFHYVCIYCNFVLLLSYTFYCLRESDGTCQKLSWKRVRTCIDSYEATVIMLYFSIQSEDDAALEQSAEDVRFLIASITNVTFV